MGTWTLRTAAAAKASAAALAVASFAACGGSAPSEDGGEPGPTATAPAQVPEAVTGGDAPQGPIGPELPASVRLAADRWVADVFSVCVEDGYYDRDTSDVLPILVGKLERGRGEALKRSIEELGAMGAESVPALRRLLDTQLNDATRAGSIQNTLGALAQNDSVAAAEQLCRALDHPHSAIRINALRGLTDGPVPVERFDQLVGLSRIGNNSERGLAMQAMHVADRERSESLFLDWLERGELERVEDAVLPLLVGTPHPAIVERAAALLPDLQPLSKAWVSGALARAGEAAGVDALRELLVDERAAVRGTALRAAAAAGRWDEVVAVFRNDPDPGTRASAIAALHSGLASLAAGEPEALEIAPDPDQEAAVWAALRSALNGSDPLAATEARSGLVALGDEEALSRALADLDGSATTLSAVLPGLRKRMDLDPALGERVLARLRARVEAEGDLPWAQRVATFQAVSVVRTRAAAELLMAYADRAAADGATLSGLDAYRWFCVHATNTGPEGRGYLAELLATEPDPIRRLGLTFAVGGERDDFARQVLRGRLDDDSLEPLERLYVASLMTSLGPAAEVAPRLKRAALRATDADERRGLQCLLWFWY